MNEAIDTEYQCVCDCSVWLRKSRCFLYIFVPVTSSLRMFSLRLSLVRLARSFCNHLPSSRGIDLRLLGMIYVCVRLREEGHDYNLPWCTPHSLFNMHHNNVKRVEFKTVTCMSDPVVLATHGTVPLAACPGGVKEAVFMWTMSLWVLLFVATIFSRIIATKKPHLRPQGYRLPM